MEPHIKELIIAQINKSGEKIEAAKTLLEDGYLDDAISRAYYSMFHAASAVLLSEGLTVKSHSALKNTFGLHFVKTGRIDKRYARALNKLKDERENGDYDIYTSFEDEDAVIAIEEAKHFLKEMKRYLSQNHNIGNRLAK